MSALYLLPAYLLFGLPSKVSCIIKYHLPISISFRSLITLRSHICIYNIIATFNLQCLFSANLENTSTLPMISGIPRVSVITTFIYFFLNKFTIGFPIACTQVDRSNVADTARNRNMPLLKSRGRKNAINPSTIP